MSDEQSLSERLTPPAQLNALATTLLTSAGVPPDPATTGRVRSRRGATALVDGQRAFGQLAARRAAAELAELCAEFAVGVVAIEDCDHVGRLGEYAADLAERGLVAVAFASADPTVAPYGGRERRLGTNPLAWALPRADGRAPVVMDRTTAAVAEGKLGVAGAASTDPGDFYRGGALLPFGGHKAMDLVTGESVVVDGGKRIRY
ncbi:Ldh family oxidoreductase [Streptomyces radicis]|uniref:Uncharacterized protein n=1 Tax=Streptomyces radicis TaxID=1750517 RepID=A0A3A9W2S8_9ACTN|nr:Ldh family oxidoreductase [Streptomyces radicis]RKN03514.1 hypothetical protein D7319_31345 [Streptomyces radicis]RKN20322.1 hypothetical protein D7318_19465 [Streptomyces radicis]